MALVVNTIFGDFDRSRYQSLVKEYEAARKRGLNKFGFDGELINVELARHLIDYLGSRLK